MEPCCNLNQDLTDGVYNVVLEDDAGNRSDVQHHQRFTVDLTKPILDNLILINETDTGFNNSDRLSNKASPEIQFTSEPGLRIEVQGVELTTTKLEKDNFSINDDNGTYTIALSNGVELSDGTYNIVAKDDSGNESLLRKIYLLLSIEQIRSFHQ